MSDNYKKINDKCWEEREYSGDKNNLIEVLRWLNSDKCVYYGHQLYMAVNSVNTDGIYDGATHTAHWYMRNLKIFSNIQNLCESCERLLVIIGEGHLAILRHLIQSCDNMELVNIDEYLLQCIE